MRLAQMMRCSRPNWLLAWSWIVLAGGCSRTAAPVNHLPGPQTTAQDTPLVLSASTGNAISVQVEDGGPALVALAAVHGSLTLSGTGGLAFSEGTGSGDAAMVFSGALDAVNAALEGMVFTPEAGFTGPASLRIETSDARFWPFYPTMRDTDALAITVLAGGEDHPPVAVDDVLSIAEDASLEVPVLANDTDADGDALSVTSVTQGAHGSVALDAGRVVYTPAPNHAGSDSFGYTVSDGRGGTADATVQVTVDAVNDPPVNGLPGPQDVNEDATLTFSTGGGNALSVADVDAGGGVEQVALAATHGIVTLSGTSGLTITAGANGSAALTFTGTLAAVGAALEGLTFTPDPVLSLETQATLRISTDDLGNTGAGGAQGDADTVTITVHPVEHAPVASDDTAFTAEDTGVDVHVLANDGDVDGDALTVTAAGPASSGAVLIVSGTYVHYAPAADFNGVDSFSYTVSDGRGEDATATVSMTVSAVNDPPMAAVPGAQSTDRDTPLVFSTAGGNAVRATDVDAGTADLQVTLTAGHGTATLSGTAGLAFSAGDGTADATMTFTGPQASIRAALDGMRFVPSADYAGPASLQLTTSDLGHTGAGGSLGATASVSITVNATNRPPVAVADSFQANESPAVAHLDVLANDTDPDGDALTITSVTQGAHGTVTFDADQVVYSPAAGYGGPDSFGYTVSDGRGGTASATVTVTVNLVNDPPVNTVPGSQDVNEDVALTFSTGDGNAISVADPDAGSAAVQVALTATHGILTLSGTTGLTLTGGANGSASLTFRGTLAAVDAALDGLTFTPDPVLGIQTLATLQIVSDDLGNTGVGGARTDSDTVNITVHPVQHAPVAVADTASTQEDTGVDVHVLTNDHDVDGDALTVTATGAAASGGTVQIVEGTYVHYTPAPNLNGPDSFSYTVSDGQGGTATATVSVTVNAVNDPPVNSVPGQQVVHAGTPLVFAAPLANPISVADVDAGGAAVQVSLTAANGTVTLPNPAGLTITGGANGSATLTVRGTLTSLNAALNGATFTSAPATFTGAASLTVQTSDLCNAGAGGCLVDSDAIGINVTDQPPSAADDAYASIAQNVGILLPVLANDTDPDGDALIVQSVGSPAHGITFVAGNSARYTPTAGYFGPDSFTYTVSDGHGMTDTATVRLRVNAAYSATGNTFKSFAAPGPLQNDAGGTTVTSTGDVTSAHGGTATLRADGSFDFLPARDYEGVDTFTYTVRDGSGASSTGTVEVTTSGMIWYVDAAVPGGDGRSTRAYATVQLAQSASRAGSSIYVARNASAYAGGITLKNDQELTGATSSSGGRSWAKSPNAAAGSRPTITNTSGPAVVLASRNTVTGLTLAGVGSSGNLAIRGTSVSATTLGALDVHPTAGADTVGGVSITGPGSLAMTDVQLSRVTGHGLTLAGTLTSATLTHVVIDSPTGDGIRLEGTVSEFTLTRDTSLVDPAGRSAVTNAGAAALDFATGSGQLTGTATVAYATLSSNAGDALRVETASGALTLTVDHVNVTKAGGLGNGVLVRADGSPAVTLTVTSSTFAGVTGDAVNIGTERGAAVMHATIGGTGPSTNTFVNTSDAAGLGDSAVRVNASGAGASMYFQVIGNTISGWQGTAVSVTGTDDHGQVNGTISGNLIGTGPGAPGTVRGDGIGVLLDPGSGSTAMRGVVLVQDNEIRVGPNGGNGVFGLVRDGTGAASDNRLDLVLDSNVVQGAGNLYEGIFLGASGTTTLCTAWTGNASGAGAGASYAYLLKAPTPAGGTPSLIIEGVPAGSSAAAAEAYLSTAGNTGTPLTVSITGSLAGGTCTRPTSF